MSTREAMTECNITTMSDEQKVQRAKLLKKLARGTKLLVTTGIKKGRTAIFVGAHPDNPWLLNTRIDRIPRIVRWDYVVIV